MIGIVDLEPAEADLAAGTLTCPQCGGVLRRWGHGRPAGSATTAPRRCTCDPAGPVCAACGTTQVLLPGELLPRRADTTAVIGAALLASSCGAGYRRIAADLGRPLSTVRRWIRSILGGHTEWLRTQGVEWICRVDRDVFATIDAAPTPLGEALAALAAAAVTVQARLAPHLPHWTLIGRLTLWQLVTPAAPRRPGRRVLGQVLAGRAPVAAGLGGDLFPRRPGCA